MTLIRLLLTGVFIFYGCISLHAQEGKKIDSLKLVLKYSKEDTNKVKILNNISGTFSDLLLNDSAVLYNNKAMELSIALNYQKGIGAAYRLFGIINLYNTNDSIAINNFLKALKIFKEIGSKFDIASVLSNIGIYYIIHRKDNLAINYLLQALQMMETLGRESNVAKILINISAIYRNSSGYDSSNYYLLKALKISEKVGDKLSTLIVLTNLGINYSDQSNSPIALDYFFKAVKISEEIGIKDPALYRGIGEAYLRKQEFSTALEFLFKSLNLAEELKMNRIISDILYKIGYAYWYKGDKANAIDYYLKALRKAEENGDKYDIANAFSSLGETYHNMDQYSIAMDYLLKALQIVEEIKTNILLPKVTHNLALVYISMYRTNNEDSCLANANDLLLKGLRVSKQIGNKHDVGNILLSLGRVAYYQRNYSKALQYYFEALKIYESMKSSAQLASTLNYIGSVYSAQKENSKAEMYLSKALSIADTSQVIELKLNFYSDLSDFYMGTGNYKKALDHYKKAVALKDSLLNESTNNKISQLKIEYETEKKDQEIANLNKEQKIKDLEIEQKKKELQAQQLEQEKKQQAIALLESSKKIQALTLQKKEKEVLDLLKDKKIKELEIQQNKQELRTQQLEKEKQQQSIDLLLSSQKIKESEIKLLQKNRQNQQLILSQKQTEINRKTTIYLSIVALAALAIVSLFFYNRYKRTNEKAKSEREIARLEQKALQLQMNPHFIFNALNSIEQYVAIHEGELAESFINKFSKLTRLILEASRESFISISKELELLNNYLSIEQVRFNQSFDYEIKIDNKINPEETCIPPMLIQPYIENAIIHGINHSRRDGKIEIELKQEVSKLTCIITDNGIGINRSIARRQQTAGNISHQSIGMKAIQERLKVLSALYSVELKSEVIDLGGIAKGGTKVIFEMPIKNLV